VLRQVGDTLMRHEYALWLADRTGVEAQEVVRALDAQPATTRRSSPTPKIETPVALAPHHKVEFEALRSILAYPELLNDEGMTEDDFTMPLHRSLFRLLSS